MRPAMPASALRRESDCCHCFSIFPTEVLPGKLTGQMAESKGLNLPSALCSLLFNGSVIRRRLGRNRPVHLEGCAIERLQVGLAAHAHISGELGLRHLDDTPYACFAI